MATMNPFGQVVNDLAPGPVTYKTNEVVAFRVTQEQWDFIYANGGPGFVRELIIEAMKSDVRNV